MGNNVKDLNPLLGEYRNELTIIYGPAGSGKTTLALLACLSAAQTGHKVLFLDAEQGFSVERFKQLAGPQYEAHLTKIFLIHLNSFQEQSRQISNLVSTARNFRLIVLDTIGTLFRREYKADPTFYTRELEKQVRILGEISRNVAVVITNQVYATMQGSTAMIGSEQLARWCHRIICLEKNPRRIIQEKPNRSETRFEILETGIKLCT